MPFDNTTIDKTDIRRARLLRLREIAETANLEMRVAGIERNLCGTVGCLGGWACQDELFGAEGLLSPSSGWPGSSTLARFFHLSEWEAIVLFAADCNSWGPDIKREKVVANIDRLLRNERPVGYFRCPR